MTVWDELVGNGQELSEIQMCVRAFIIFIISYLFIRISGRRSFGLHSPMDNIIVILLGAILSRAVVGASPFSAVVCAGITLVLLHRLLGWIISRYPKIAELTAGKKMILFEKGQLNHRNMARSLVSESDVKHAVRKLMQEENFSKIETVYMEGNGEITIIKKSNRNNSA